jgi:hypothetical protein
MIAALRTVDCWLAATVARIAAAPCPEAALKLTHVASVLAFHEQSRAESTLIVAEPPSAETSRVSEVNVTWQRTGSGPFDSVTLVAPHAHAVKAKAITMRCRALREYG